MKRLWIALPIILTIGVLPSLAIETVTPEIGDSTVTFTDLTLPVPQGSKAASEPKVIPGLRQNAQLRSNLIVAGAVPKASSITLRLFVGGTAAATSTETVPAYGLLQTNRIARDMGANTVNDGYVENSVDSGAVFAAISVVDGSADDAAFILAESVLD